MSEIIRAYRARVPLPRATSDDVPAPGFTDTYRAVQREAERNERANQRGMARIYRAVRQANFGQSVEPLAIPKQTGIQKVFVYP